MKLLTLPQVAERLGVSESLARKIAADMPGRVLLRGRTRITEEGLAEFVRRGGSVQPATEPAA